VKNWRDFFTTVIREPCILRNQDESFAHHDRAIIQSGRPAAFMISVPHLPFKVVDEMLRAFPGKQLTRFIRHISLVAQAFDFIALLIRHHLLCHPTFAFSRI